MRIKIGVMGSAGDTLTDELLNELREKAEQMGRALAAAGVVVLTGGTTGLPAAVGEAARGAGALHIGISPAADEAEHRNRFRYPTDNCDLLIYTGFGLKGRNVVLVRSSDILLFIRGSMGALNEFTIAHDEGKIIGCLTGTGGVADHASQLLEIFRKQTRAQIFFDDEPARLVRLCLDALARETSRRATDRVEGRQKEEEQKEEEK